MTLAPGGLRNRDRVASESGSDSPVRRPGLGAGGYQSFRVLPGPPSESLPPSAQFSGALLLRVLRPLSLYRSLPPPCNAVDPATCLLAPFHRDSRLAAAESAPYRPFACPIQALRLPRTGPSPAPYSLRPLPPSPPSSTRPVSLYLPLVPPLRRRIVSPGLPQDLNSGFEHRNQALASSYTAACWAMLCLRPS